MPTTPDISDTALVRSLEASASFVDLTERTVRFSFSSTRPVSRYGWMLGISGMFDEVLSHDPAHVRLERLEEETLMFLRNHDRNQDLGKVISIEFSDRTKADAVVRLNGTAAADEFLSKVQEGTAPGFSFTYQVYRYEEVSSPVFELDEDGRKIKTKNGVLMGTDWEILEISTETVPADPSVGLGKSSDSTNLPEIVFLKAAPTELAVGDWVSWNSSGGAAKGRITEKRTSGSVQPRPTGKAMKGSRDNPAFLCNVYRQTLDGWMATDIYTAHRAGTLTKVESLKTVTTINPGDKGDQAVDEEDMSQLQEQMRSLQSQLDELRKSNATLQTALQEKDEAIAQRDQQLQTLQRTQQITAAYNALRQEAGALVKSNAPKLSAAEFEALGFSGDAEADIKSLLEMDPARADAVLGQVEFYLKTAKARNPILQTTLRTGGEPLPNKEGDRKSPSLAGESPQDYAKRLVSGLHGTPVV